LKNFQSSIAVLLKIMDFPVCEKADPLEKIMQVELTQAADDRM